MKYRKYLALAARILGLVFLFNGFRATIDFVLILMLGDFDLLFVGYILAVTLFYLFTGVYLLRGAPGLIEFAFKDSRDDFDIDE